MTTPGVDFFRVDRGRGTTRMLMAAGALVAVGGSIVGAHLVHRLDAQTSAPLSLAGGITLLTGLLVGFGTMARLLFENIWLVIRDDGVLLHDNGHETSIAWGELEDVVVDGTGHLVLARASAEAVRWYAGRSAPTIATRIQAARRKGLHGLPVAAT